MSTETKQKMKLKTAINVIKAVNRLKKFQEEHVKHIKNNQQNQQDLHEGIVTTEQITTDNPESICYNLYNDHKASSSSETNYNKIIISFLNNEGEKIITQGNKEIQKTKYGESGQKALNLMKKMEEVDEDITVGHKITDKKVVIHTNNVKEDQIKLAEEGVREINDNTAGFIHLPGKTTYLFTKENGKTKVKGLGDFLTHYSNKLEKDGSSSVKHIETLFQVTQQQGGSQHGGQLNPGENNVVYMMEGSPISEASVKKVRWFHKRRNREIVVLGASCLACIFAPAVAGSILVVGTGLISMNCGYKWLMGKEKCGKSIWRGRKALQLAYEIISSGGGRKRRTRKRKRRTKKRKKRTRRKKKRRRTKKKRRGRRRSRRGGDKIKGNGKKCKDETGTPGRLRGPNSECMGPPGNGHNNCYYSYTSNDCKGVLDRYGEAKHCVSGQCK